MSYGSVGTVAEMNNYFRKVRGKKDDEEERDGISMMNEDVPSLQALRDLGA